MDKKVFVKPIFLSGKISSTLIIPKEIARKFGLDEPSNVVIEVTENGILIRKLEI
jgi:AbrB family looped-hinge helix DNA binding protein